jgi:hypothetical protein
VIVFVYLQMIANKIFKSALPWLIFLFSGIRVAAQTSELLIYHQMQTDRSGNIVPWYNADPAIAYDHNLYMIWNFWDTMRRDINGLPYYMNHQVWNAHLNDPRGIGGDQFMMALSSWRLLYAYTGNEKIKENMSFIAGYYLTHGLSPANCVWPNIPFPYNTLIYSGIYDGDMRNGKDVTQPDKAGSFGLELIHMYKFRNDPVFLNAAIKIANTLAAKMTSGSEFYSPIPFKVNVFTGETAMLKLQNPNGKFTDTAGYTSNLTPTLQMFLDLIELKEGNIKAYQNAFDEILAWLLKYPIQNNRWGPFFEDVGEWSETQINAMTCARFMMEHSQYFPEWKSQVKNIIDWVHNSFGNNQWEKYGVIVTNEQSVYPEPGNSHSARQAADELLFESLSGDTSLYHNAILELNWATYAVDDDGKNCFPFDEPWLTDGYGDYVRHYLRAMAVYPQLAPDADHILSSTSVIQQADYKGYFKKYLAPSFDKPDTSLVKLFYQTFDSSGTEIIKLKQKPSAVLLNGHSLKETGGGEGFTWKLMNPGGVLIVRRTRGNRIIVLN